MLLRWWASGLRFGDITVTSHLRTAADFGVYLRFLWYALLFTLVAIVVGSIGAIVGFGAIVSATARRSSARFSPPRR